MTSVLYCIQYKKIVKSEIKAEYRERYTLLARCANYALGLGEGRLQ